MLWRWLLSWALFAAAGRRGAAEITFEPIPVHPYGARPHGRSSHSAVLSKAGVMYIFGGEFYNDTGCFYLDDLSSVSWVGRKVDQLEPLGEAPSARIGHSAVFDDARGAMYLFGGCAAGNHFGDLFAYNVSANEWSLLSRSGAAPGARCGHTAVFDATAGAEGRMYVFGGSSSDEYFNDLHAYDVASNTWARLSPTGIAPTPRDWTAAAFDAAPGRMYVFGGWGYQGASHTKDGRLYVYDVVANSWAELATGPLWSDHDTMFDPDTNQLYALGASDADGIEHGDVHAYDVATDSWSKLAYVGTPLPPRVSLSAVWDTESKNMYVFGGKTEKEETVWPPECNNELWRMHREVHIDAAQPERRSDRTLMIAIVLGAVAVVATFVAAFYAIRFYRMTAYYRSRDPAWAAISLEQLNELRSEAKDMLGDRYHGATMYDINELLIRPACENTGKPWAHIKNSRSLKRANVFISHAWAENFDEFCESVNQVFLCWKEKPNIWICALALVQSSDPKVIERQVGMSSDPRKAPFTRALRNADKLLIVRNRAVDLYSRIWCCWELAAAHELGFTRRPGALLVAGPAAFPSQDSVDLSSAHASNPEDKKKIMQHVERKRTLDAVNRMLSEIKDHHTNV